MTTVAQRSFSGGEIAPALYARVDTVKYATGLRTCRNFLVMRHGGAQNRPGADFICEVKDSSKSVIMMPFIFNSSQTYILEFGNEYMRVIKDGVQVTDLDLTITGITNANPAVVTYTGTDPVDGDEVAISGIVGAIGVYLNNRNFKIANVDSVLNKFELHYMNNTAVNSTAFGAYGSGGTASRIYEIETDYIEADLPDLQFVQSADVITIVHPNYKPAELSRMDDDDWSLDDITFAPGISAPSNPTCSGTNGTVDQWVVTAIAEETLEESLPTSPVGANSLATSGSPRTIGWDAVTGAQEYNVYKLQNGVYGFIGVAGGVTFVDNGIAADTTTTPPSSRNPFNATGDYPGTVAYFQQRRMFARTDNNPEKVWSTRSGQFNNLTTSSPLQDDDAVTFTLVGRQVNEVKHLLDLGTLLSLTSGGEWVIQGDGAGVLKPTDINAKQQSYNGSSSVRPLIIGGNALYIQARGSIVRDLGFEFQTDSYRGNDLTIFSAHLIDGFTIVDWAYQQIPNSIVWAVRNDGVLLGLTYVREQQVFAWHRHDTDGFVERVCVIPEGTEDSVYLVIKRTIGGATKRYIEKFNSRHQDDVKDFVLMDSALSYDGRNTNTSHTMTLSGGTTWVYTDTLTLTANFSFFSASDVGNEIQLTGSDGTLIRFSITGYTSATVVTGKANKDVPVVMRSTAISNWTKAVDQVGGLWHLEGKEVSVFGDGFVVASPNNDSYETVTITNGIATLDRPYGVIHVGLPYISDIESLDLDTAQSETISDKKKMVSKLTIFVESSRGIFAGTKPPTDDDVDPLENLYELKIRTDEEYDDSVALKTGVVDINLKPEWNSNGRVFIRQVDPLPLAVLAIAPAGFFPFKGA